MLTSFIIGERIAKARRACGLSQTQLANRLSISSQAVGKWERGESMPDIIMFNSLAQALGVDMNYFSESFQEMLSAEERSDSMDSDKESLAKNKAIDSDRESDTDTASADNLRNIGAENERGNEIDGTADGSKIKVSDSKINLNKATTDNKSDRDNIDGAENNQSEEDFLRMADELDELESKNKPVWNLSGWSWENADFSGLKNLGERISGANISSCLFVGSDLSRLRLWGNRMVKSDFSKTDFRKSKIRAAQLSGNNFSGGLFNETLFGSSIIKDCDFSNADLTNTIFRFCNLSKSCVSGAKLKCTEFINSQFTDMTFEGELEDCSFINCNFTKVIFENVRLINTFFKCRTKKITFINCQADTITYAFLKTGKADMSGVTLIK